MSLRLTTAFFLAATTAFAATNIQSEAEIEGGKIVRQILGTRPAANYTNTGVLKIRAGKNSTTQIPVRFEVFLTPTDWVSAYQTMSSNGASPSIRLLVTRQNGVNRYELATLTTDDACCPTNTVLTNQQAMMPFAGSDFWLADLGLEFFQWPGQRLLKKELRRNQSCYVIESINPAPGSNGYSRVVSWLDIDSVRDAGQPAIIHADAYDSLGRLLKAFDPKSLEKVNGQYQLQEMEIRNLQTGSRTRIEFKFDSE